nr:histidine phosphatase family protein [Actinospica robiniae]
MTRRGRGQAAYTAMHLAASTGADSSFDVLYASPRRRCVESAEPVAKALNLDVVFAPALRSLDHGPGDPWDPASNAIGTIRLLAHDAAALPGAECWARNRQRAGGFLGALAARHSGRSVLIIAHAETQDAALAAYFGLAPDSGARAYEITWHTGISRWRHHRQVWPGAHEGGAWALLAHNDVRHLAGTGLEPHDTCWPRTTRI